MSSHRGSAVGPCRLRILGSLNRDQRKKETPQVFLGRSLQACISGAEEEFPRKPDAQLRGSVEIPYIGGVEPRSEVLVLVANVSCIHSSVAMLVSFTATGCAWHSCVMKHSDWTMARAS